MLLIETKAVHRNDRGHQRQRQCQQRDDRGSHVHQEHTTTRMTRAAPSMNAVNRLFSDCSMKSACLKRSRWICIP